MTRTAKALGMKNTTFKNANGLTAKGHLSTAHDMSILGRHLFYDFPQYYNIFSRRTTDAGMATVANTNRRFLDSYKGADGIKTGYTEPAGFNLTAIGRARRRADYRDGFWRHIDRRSQRQDGRIAGSGLPQGQARRRGCTDCRLRPMPMLN